MKLTDEQKEKVYMQAMLEYVAEWNPKWDFETHMAYLLKDFESPDYPADDTDNSCRAWEPFEHFPANELVEQIVQAGDAMIRLMENPSFHKTVEPINYELLADKCAGHAGVNLYCKYGIAITSSMRCDLAEWIEQSLSNTEEGEVA